jgi:hypothetical protein
MRFSKFTPFLLLLTAVATAGACPDCSIKNNTTLVEQGSTTAKMALSDNVLLMIGVVLSVLGVLIWMMVKTCNDLAKERTLSGVTRI